MNIRVLFILGLLYGVPVITLYVYILCVIISSNKFNTTWYYIFIIDGFVNLFTYFNAFYVYRLSSVTSPDDPWAVIYTIIKGYELLKQVFVWLSFQNAYSQYSIASFMTMNKYAMLMNWQITCKKWHLWIWIGAISLISIVLDTAHFFLYPASLVIVDDGYALKSERPEQFSRLMIGLGLLMVISAIFNVLSFGFLIKIKTLLSAQNQERERSQLLLTTAITVVQGLGFGITYLQSQEISGFYTAILPFISDALSTVNPLLLIGFHKTVRKRLLKLFPCYVDPNVTRVRPVVN